MPESIWSKKYKLPDIKLNKVIYTIMLILAPNLIFLFISIYTGTSRPFLNIDYILPIMFLLLKNKLCRWLGFISLFIMVIPDTAMFIIQLFPFMDLQGLLYLAPFLLQGPTRYIVFVLAISIYAISLPVVIRALSKPTDNYHALAASIIILFLSYFASTSNLEYKEGSRLTLGSNNNYITASQTSLYFEIQDMSFLKEAKVAPSFSPTKFDRIVSKLNKPFNDKILLIIVESLGAPSNSDIQKEILKPVSEQRGFFEYYDDGYFEAPASTISGEIKELCAQDIKGFGLRLIPDISFPTCLPRILTDKGYQTKALHGGNGNLYDRFSWYKKAGFTNITFSENLHEAQKCSAFHGICDNEVFPIIKDYFKEDRSAFFHWMTLTSHAPYAEKDIYSQRFDCTHYGVKDEVCRNMRLQAQFFEGLSELNSQPEMSGVEVVLVGDHSPPITSGTEKFKNYKQSSVLWLHYKIK
ncbi:MAG: hypothetical protein ACI9ST_000165 [Psychrobacter glaciei]|jgi:hypothetical protein|uniref:sulfatase-like hydrolase/transferase n=1 Tax=Psychrobacter glaciei TaxID=619771 RepID=UPI0039E2E956